MREERARERGRQRNSVRKKGKERGRNRRREICYACHKLKVSLLTLEQFAELHACVVLRLGSVNMSVVDCSTVSPQPRPWVMFSALVCLYSPLHCVWYE